MPLLHAIHVAESYGEPPTLRNLSQFSIAGAVGKRGYTAIRGISLQRKDLSEFALPFLWPSIHESERCHA
jgi:hypothetical protein